ADGTWKFKGWSPATLKVSATDTENKFKGTWEFTADKKTVTHEFVSGTEGKALPTTG
ncbi:SHIRT domain-containing protein, partial [Peptoniphilus genitalis]